MKNIDLIKSIVDQLIELSKDELQSAIEAITDISEGNPTYDLTAENERS